MGIASLPLHRWAHPSLKVKPWSVEEARTDPRVSVSRSFTCPLSPLEGPVIIYSCREQPPWLSLANSYRTGVLFIVPSRSINPKLCLGTSPNKGGLIKSHCILVELFSLLIKTLLLDFTNSFKYAQTPYSIAGPVLGPGDVMINQKEMVPPMWNFHSSHGETTIQWVPDTLSVEQGKKGKYRLSIEHCLGHSCK